MNRIPLILMLFVTIAIGVALVGCSGTGVPAENPFVAAPDLPDADVPKPDIPQAEDGDEQPMCAEGELFHLGACVDGNTVISVPDPGLRACMHVALGTSEEVPITIAEARSVTAISTSSYYKPSNDSEEIADLTGIEHFTNLTQLWIKDGTIDDISALRGLVHLDALVLYRNQITDISPLENLRELRFLILSENQISDIRPLTNLSNLEALSLSSNMISDVGALSSMTNLCILDLSENSSDFELETLQTLRVLSDAGAFRRSAFLDGGYIGYGIDLSGSVDLDDPDVIAFVEELRSQGVDVKIDERPQPSDGTVNKYKETVVNIPDPVLRMRIKEALSINPDDSILSTHAKTLTSLDARGCGSDVRCDTDDDEEKIQSIAGLASFTNLESLNLGCNQISDISDLEGMENLTWISLSYNQISDISALEGMGDLEALYLSGNQIRNISPLKRMGHVNYLTLVSNPLGDIMALRRMYEAGSFAEDSRVSDYNIQISVSDLWPRQNFITLNYLESRDVEIERY